MWPPVYAGSRGPLFDVCANRHRGNAESRAANPTREAKAQSHELILAELRLRGPMTSVELAAAMGTRVNCISGRLSELKAAGRIRKTGEIRDGCAVLEMAK